ncbi:hypothetical protein HAL013_15320 [Helicobacter ailurogastricus]|uniref:Uncharacterized protein n=1 Tax=Helicobacter ailurogastricus TaxID=1578720 RepID=A0A0K2X9X5_9HELI|nr:hypothetical protein HAL013_15320 [Helicobacter ailurogastricus]
MALALSACAPRVVYQKVYIPTKCQITPTKRPSKDLGVLEYLQELLIYTEQLELDLQHCIDNSVSRPKNPYKRQISLRAFSPSLTPKRRLKAFKGYST